LLKVTNQTMRAIVGFSSSKGSTERYMFCRRRLTNRWSGRVKDKVPSSNAGVRAAQLNR